MLSSMGYTIDPIGKIQDMRNTAFIVAVFVCALVSSTSRAQDGWRYEESIDEFDGEIIYEIWFENNNDDFSLAINCSSEGFTIVFGLRGNFLGQRSQERMRVKFDSEEPIWLKIDEHWDVPTGTVFSTWSNQVDISDFIRRMRKHMIMKMEIYTRSLLPSREIKTVRLTGFTAEIMKAPAYCR